MVTWIELKDLLARSYVLVLLEDFLDRFDGVVYGSLSFSLLASRQESFDHVLEVFEQDLRIGEQTALCVWASEDPGFVLRSCIVALLVFKGSSLADNLAVKGLLGSSELELGSSWAAQR